MVESALRSTRRMRRSPVCGSRIIVDVTLDADGRVAALGQEVRACALGQASAAVMGAAAIGRSAAELDAARGALTEPAREGGASWHRASSPSVGRVYDSFLLSSSQPAIFCM